MSKQKIIKLLNDKIDNLIISNKTDSKEYKDLLKLHQRILKAK